MCQAVVALGGRNCGKSLRGVCYDCERPNVDHGLRRTSVHGQTDHHAPVWSRKLARHNDEAQPTVKWIAHSTIAVFSSMAPV